MSAESGSKTDSYTEARAGRLTVHTLQRIAPPNPTHTIHNGGGCMQWVHCPVHWLVSNPTPSHLFKAATLWSQVSAEELHPLMPYRKDKDFFCVRGTEGFMRVCFSPFFKGNCRSSEVFATKPYWSPYRNHLIVNQYIFFQWRAGGHFSNPNLEPLCSKDSHSHTKTHTYNSFIWYSRIFRTQGYRFRRSFVFELLSWFI